ncbi:MAG: MAPEG family protein, partial [Xanthomonadales bacterium]|nr:MAPEG family protein [Xanthomonadales bacterium]
MTPELNYLAWVSLFTALLWVPYILNTIAVRGITDAVGYPDHPKPLAPWAQRMKAA